MDLLYLLVDGIKTNWEIFCQDPCSNQIVWPSYRQRNCLAPPMFGGERACPKDNTDRGEGGRGQPSAKIEH